MMDDDQIQRTVDVLKREVATSPSEHFTTAPSSTIRNAVRAIDDLRAELKTRDDALDRIQEAWAASSDDTVALRHIREILAETGRGDQ